MSTPLTTQQAVDLYTTMRKIRRFEETVKAHIGKEIVGPAHLYIGEEAVATGVCSNLTHHDYVTSTHRGHGHTLAKGARFDDIKNVDYLSERAQGYGIPGVTVDGNDVESVRDASAKLIDRARRGDGPSILECKTYRRDGHFITDPQKYRSQEEVEEWKLYNDPIDRFRRKIMLEGVVAQNDLDAAEERLDQEFAQALEFAVNSPFPKAEDALDDVFSGEVNLYE